MVYQQVGRGFTFNSNAGLGAGRKSAMWTSGFLDVAGLGGALNVVSETLGLVALVGLCIAYLTWLTFPSEGDAGQTLNQHGAD